MRVSAMAVVLSCLILGACTAKPRPRADDRARDSAIGASSLPGAQGVRGALRATDSATSRRAVEDSIARETGP
jgi:hypothetical protein